MRRTRLAHNVDFSHSTQTYLLRTHVNGRRSFHAVEVFAVRWIPDASELAKFRTTSVCDFLPFRERDFFDALVNGKLAIEEIAEDEVGP